MELVEKFAWGIARYFDTTGGFYIVRMFTTKEEADEKIKEYSGCKGDFKVKEFRIWLPEEI